MRAPALRSFVLSASLAALALACSGCNSTSKQAGSVAGDVVGGTAWVAMKGATLAGRTVKGAAHGVHEEFSKPSKTATQTQTVASK
jgi:hypothetical protein